MSQHRPTSRASVSDAFQEFPPHFGAISGEVSMAMAMTRNPFNTVKSAER